MLLTAFLASVTVPALNSWIHGQKGQVLERKRVSFEAVQRGLGEPDQHRVPDRWRTKVDDAHWSWYATPPGHSAFSHEQLFSPEQFDRFSEKITLEGRFKRSLEAPELLKPSRTRDGIELRWDLPEGVATLRNELADDPLLSVGFRVYRWRENEEPVLLATQEVTQTYYRDRDLPLWRQKFSYCVFTVMEGKIGDLPTLVESKRSPVIEVETLENFSVEVLDGAAGQAVVQVAAYREGRWIPEVITVHPGDRLAGSMDLEAGTGEESAIAFDTGLTVEDILIETDTRDEPVRRPEFLPDGRRKVDLATGNPTYVNQTATVQVRTLTLHCRDQAAATRTFTSRALR